MKRPFLFAVGLLLAGLLLLSACTGAAPAPAAAPTLAPGAELPGILVEAEWLAGNLDGVRVIDVRAASRYQDAHVPGAVNLALGDITINDPVAGMLATPGQVEQVLGSLGIGNDSPVVIYDDGNNLSASRLYWALDHYGHSKIALLNGGYAKWAAESREVTRVAPKVTAATFTARVDSSEVATKQYVLDNLSNPNVKVLDVRSPGEYAGTDVRAERGGHIPGAVNINWTSTLAEGQVPVLKPVAELKAMYEAAGVTTDKEIITYCQTAVRGAHTYFVLRLLGYDKVRNYDGSWAEWGNDPRTPIEK